MPKRKTSHDYCRVRFGIFKRRRVSTGSISSNPTYSTSMISSSPAVECDGDDCRCVVRVRRQKFNEVSPQAQHNLTSMTSITTGGHRIPQPPVCFQHFSLGPPSLKCMWSGGDCSNSNVSVGSRSGNGFQQQSKLLPTIVDTCSSILSNNNHPKCSYSFSTGSISRTTRMLQLQPVQNFSKLTTDSDDRFQKVMNLVALTSSLKLSEDNSTLCKSQSSCQSLDTSNATSHDKEQMELTQSKPSTDTCCPSVMTDLASNFWNETTASSSSSCFGFTVDFKTKGASYSPHCSASSRNHRPHSAQQTKHKLHYSTPRLNRGSPEDSSDSDEGFCEPVSKRIPSSDSKTQPGKEMNLVETNHRTLLNRSKYTNYLVNTSSSSPTCSLFWQMMSNQYGIRTKISYSIQGSCTSTTSSCIIPGVEIKSAQPGRCITRWKQKPLMAQESRGEFSSQQQQSGVHIFAVGKLLQDQTNVEGTLFSGLQHAVNCNKSFFIFDCEIGENAVQTGTCQWYRYCHNKSTFLPCHCLPVLKQNFAGVCTNELPQAGRVAIKALFLRTFGTP